MTELELMKLNLRILWNKFLKSPCWSEQVVKRRNILGRVKIVVKEDFYLFDENYNYVKTSQAKVNKVYKVLKNDDFECSEAIYPVMFYIDTCFRKLKDSYDNIYPIDMIPLFDLNGPLLGCCKDLNEWKDTYYDNPRDPSYLFRILYTPKKQLIKEENLDKFKEYIKNKYKDLTIKQVVLDYFGEDALAPKNIVSTLSKIGKTKKEHDKKFIELLYVKYNQYIEKEYTDSLSEAIYKELGIKGSVIGLSDNCEKIYSYSKYLITNNYLILTNTSPKITKKVVDKDKQ